MQTAPSAISGFTAVTSGGKAKGSNEQVHDEASGFANQLRSAMPEETEDDGNSRRLDGTASSVDSEFDEQRVQNRHRLANRSPRAGRLAHSAPEVGAPYLESSADLQAIATLRPEANEERQNFGESESSHTDKLSASLAHPFKQTDSHWLTDEVKRDPNDPLVQDQQLGPHREQQGELESLDSAKQRPTPHTRDLQAVSPVATAATGADAALEPELLDKTNANQSLSSTAQPNAPAVGGEFVVGQPTTNGVPSDSASGSDKSDQRAIAGPDGDTRSKPRTPATSLAREAQPPLNRRVTGGDAQSASPVTKPGAATANARSDNDSRQATDTRRAPRKVVAAKSGQHASSDLPAKTASAKNEMPSLKPSIINPVNAPDPESDRLGVAIHRPSASASRASTELALTPGILPDIEAPLDPENVSEAFQGQLTERLVIAIKNDMSRADIRITPNELGPISIELTVEGNTASVSFAAENSQTRNALQDSLSFLRDQLAREGLSLGEASVGEQADNAFNRRDNDRPTDEWTAIAGETAEPISDASLPAGYRPPASGQGLVDLFA